MTTARTAIGATEVVSFSAHLPGLSAGTELAGWDPGHACAPEDAHELLGRKGLLYKEPATRMALCAVHRALGAPVKGSRRKVEDLDPDVGVVVSSNLGNAHTVGALAKTVQAAGTSDVSPLDAPNASSNVIASSVAIWFRLGGPNLTVCSGTPAGLDAVRLAQLLIAAGRAKRVVVVGVEPSDGTTRTWLSTEDPPLAAAACVVLEPTRPDSTLRLGQVLDVADSTEPVLLIGDRSVAKEVSCGRAYGATGVLSLAIAAGVLVSRPEEESAKVVCGSAGDGVRETTLIRGRTS